MESRTLHSGDGSPGMISRRGLLKGAAGLAAVWSTSAWATSHEDHSWKHQGSIFAYVGTYTPNGEGIHLLRMNPWTGALTPIKVFPSGDVNPSWIAFDPKRKYLYAANEIFDATGSVSAFAIDRSTGDLTHINTVSSAGDGPAHLSVDPLGKYVFVANYGGGNVAVLPILSGGALGPATDVVADNSVCSPAPCPLGPIHAENAPPGSFAISGHDAPHAHMIQTDPAGNYVIAQDLGLDLTIVWKLDRTNGKLINHQTVSSSPGAGPRHFAFHPNGHWFYSLNEEASTLTFMTYDPKLGLLTPQQEIPTLPPEFKGTSFTSEVIVSPDGQFVYAANRLHDTIAIFDVGRSGRVTRLGEVWTRADYARNINIDPTGRFMYACHNRSDNITIFRIDGGGRQLTFAGEYAAVGSPAIIIFLE